jgi:hypothetical protein
VANFKDLVADSANINASTGAITELPKSEKIDIDKAPGAIIK